MNNVQRAILGVLESGTQTNGQLRERLWALSNITKVSLSVVRVNTVALERNGWIRRGPLGWVLRENYTKILRPRETSRIADIQNAVVFFVDGTCWAKGVEGSWRAMGDSKYRWEGKLVKA